MRLQESPQPASSRTLEPEERGPGEILRVLRPDGSVDPETDPGVGSADLAALYKLMLLNRALDERMITLQRQGRIGFYIGSVGEEAAVIGSAFVMRPADWVFPSYREHGAALMRGLPLRTFLSNLYGNSEDPVQGRQMPCHEAWKPGNIASISSPLGTQLPQAVGLSWAAKLKGRDEVALAYFGDGTTSSNDFHVAMNFAGVFKAPTIFLCRNNQWAISVPVSRQTASENLAIKAQAYGFPGVRVDGNDLLAVIAATRRAHERARGGLGPTLIEAVTYRVKGHSTSDDPRAYRHEAEVEPWTRLDPLERVQRHLTRLGVWNDAEDAAERQRIDEEIRRLTAEVERIGPPALETMFEDVYASVPWHLEEQRAEALAARASAASPAPAPDGGR